MALGSVYLSHRRPGDLLNVRSVERISVLVVLEAKGNESMSHALVGTSETFSRVGVFLALYVAIRRKLFARVARFQVILLIWHQISGRVPPKLFLDVTLKLKRASGTTLALGVFRDVVQFLRVVLSR